MTGKEIDCFVDDIITSEEFEIIINKLNSNLGKYINDKIKSVEQQIETDSEHLLIRTIISRCVEVNIGYEISYGFDKYIDENNVAYFKEE